MKHYPESCLFMSPPQGTWNSQRQNLSISCKNIWKAFQRPHCSSESFTTDSTAVCTEHNHLGGSFEGPHWRRISCLLFSVQHSTRNGLRLCSEVWKQQRALDFQFWMFMGIISRIAPRNKEQLALSRITQDWQTELWRNSLTEFSWGNYFFFLVKKKIY